MNIERIFTVQTQMSILRCISAGSMSESMLGPFSDSPAMADFRRLFLSSSNSNLRWLIWSWSSLLSLANLASRTSIIKVGEQVKLFKTSDATVIYNCYHYYSFYDLPKLPSPALSSNWALSKLTNAFFVGEL